MKINKVEVNGGTVNIVNGGRRILTSAEIDALTGLVPADAIVYLGWHQIKGDPNHIIQTSDGVQYACNRYGGLFEIRFTVRDADKIKGE